MADPIRRVIVCSLLAGAVLALLLVLVVFPGAPEATITGSVLLAWGLGWAVLAVVSTRRTRLPQTWAKVPALFLGAAGAALLALRPAGSALTVVSWVWPVLVVALVAWMRTQVRRSLPDRGRRILTLVMAALMIAAVGATSENIAVRHAGSAYPAPGRTYEVNGHRLHLDCHGGGGPTVVLFNGLGEVSASWAWITAEVGQVGRVCAYDRAGQGWSSEADRPQDGVAAARDLHALLAAADEPGPYVLVGHSTGGTYAMTYAARYVDDVAGLVLLDSSSPEQFTRLPAYPGQYAVMRRVTAVLPTVSRLGVARLVAAVAGSTLPATAADQVDAVSSGARAARNMRDELSVIRRVFAQAQELTTLHGRPLAIVTASGSLTETSGWAAAQNQLEALSENRTHVVVTASHEGVVVDRTAAEKSASVITAVIRAVRGGTSLEPS